jgi:hypothetical protein
MRCASALCDFHYGHAYERVERYICMAIREKLAAMLVAMVLLGCKGAQSTTAANGVNGSNGELSGDGAVAVAGVDGGGGTRIEYITDPTMNNMKVMPIQVPASWSFRGALIAKSPCTDLSEIFKSTSPDGHSFAEVMPRMGWRWGNLNAGSNSQDGCLPFDKEISALDFVKYMTTILKVEFIKEQPLPGYTGPKPIPGGQWTAALATVRYKNGSLNMMGGLQVGLFCKQSTVMGKPAGHCDAVVTYISAPENQYEQVIKLWSTPGMGRHKEMDDWVAAYGQRYANELQTRTRKFLDESNSAFAARQQMYKDQAAVQQRTHDELMQVQREGTERSMENAARIANSNHRMASDMVDYSLDQQTVLFPNSSAALKLPNTVTVDGAVRAHGDGTPW